MIKFFRKIRYDLMEKNKTGKYLKYAIGEIVLVVIGILIALQINNWNESRKENFKEREILSYTIENLKSDSLSLVKLIDNATRILKVHDDLIELSQGKIQESDITDLDAIRKSEPNIIISKKNNPDLPNKVKRQELKKAILDYFLAIDWLEFTVLNNNQIIEQSVRPFLGEKKLLNYGNRWTMNSSKRNLIHRERFFLEFKNEEIQQILFESNIKLDIMKNNAERTLSKNTKLLQSIKRYLDNHD
jgi:hypothetical protein